MPTPPDFNVGGILTAAQMDAIGFWRVSPTSVTNGTLNSDGSVTIGSAQSSVLLSGCFTSTYKWYRVVIDSVTMSSNSRATIVYCKLSASGTPASSAYHWGIPRVDLANGTVSSWYGQNNVNGCQIGTGLGDKFGALFDVGMPQVSTHTVFANINCPNDSTGYAGSGSGLHQNTASYDGFQIAVSAGTMTGGTIRVYGYN